MEKERYDTNLLFTSGFKIILPKWVLYKKDNPIFGLPL